MAETRKRRARNPEATREAILVAAQTMLAKDGPEALSLSKVAVLAGVNRGTAYQHFETREKLVAATIDWVSDQMFEAVFGRDVPGTPSLLQALGANGGGINALMRHTTAALLNTSSGAVNYGMTTAQVISAFQTAYDSGDIEGQKNRFEALNQSGCPLN